MLWRAQLCLPWGIISISMVSEGCYFAVTRNIQTLGMGNYYSKKKRNNHAINVSRSDFWQYLYHKTLTIEYNSHPPEQRRPEDLRAENNTLSQIFRQSCSIFLSKQHFQISKQFLKKYKQPLLLHNFKL